MTTGPQEVTAADDLLCPGCKSVVVIEGPVEVGREGVEDDGGRLWHAECIGKSA